MSNSTLIQLIGYIPQTSQGLFKDLTGSFIISEPFEDFSISRYEDAVNIDDHAIIRLSVYFEKLEDLMGYLKHLHLFEILKNKSIETKLRPIDRVRNMKRRPESARKQVNKHFS